MLQWGRDREIAEGVVSSAHRIQRQAHRFNGAAIVRSRKDPFHNWTLFERYDSLQLQWGRDREIAEGQLFDDFIVTA